MYRKYSGCLIEIMVTDIRCNEQISEGISLVSYVPRLDRRLRHILPVKL